MLMTGSSGMETKGVRSCISAGYFLRYQRPQHYTGMEIAFVGEIALPAEEIALIGASESSTFFPAARLAERAEESQ
jgi:hypothetical protein